MAVSNPGSLTVCVMASGPSMCQKDADLVGQWRDGESKQALAINNTFKLAPYADHIYACDQRWWDYYYESVKSLCSRATLWTYYDTTAMKYGIRQAKIPAKKTGGNSGTQAARMAITELHAVRLILLGYDMQGSSHWHGSHPKGWPNPNDSLAKSWRVHTQRLASEFPTVDVINASRETAIPDGVIRRMDLETALNLP